MHLSLTELEAKLKQITDQYVNIIYTLAENNHRSLVLQKSQFLNDLDSKIRFSSYKKKVIAQEVKIEPNYELSIDTSYDRSESEAGSEPNESLDDSGSEADSFLNNALIYDDSDDDDFQRNNSSHDEGEGSNPDEDQQESLSDQDSDQKSEDYVSKKHQKTNQSGKYSQQKAKKIKLRRRRSPSVKREILDYALQNGRYSACKKFRITRNYFSNCLSQLKNLNEYRIISISNLTALRDKLVIKWLEEKISRGQKVDKDEIADKLSKANLKLGLPKFKSPFSAVRYFFKRNRHVKQNLRSKSLYRYRRFVSKITENPYLDE